MRQKALALFALTLFAGVSALADTIDFNATGSGGTWSFSGSGPLYAGLATFNVNGSLPGGAVESGDLTLTPTVPEPASLVFLGIGLATVAGLTRLRRYQAQL